MSTTKQEKSDNAREQLLRMQTGAAILLPSDLRVLIRQLDRARAAPAKPADRERSETQRIGLCGAD